MDLFHLVSQFDTFGADKPNNLFRKYQRGNWGDTARDSVKRNNAVVKDGAEDQVFAVNNTSEGKIYIITDQGPFLTATTILFSHEY